MCADDGGEVPHTKNDCFNKNGEIDDKRLESYLMQDDNDNERKTKARIALAYMVGQRIKQEKTPCLSPRESETAHARKLGFHALGGILIRLHKCGSRRRQK